jgi:hypothetical protein
MATPSVATTTTSSVSVELTALQKRLVVGPMGNRVAFPLEILAHGIASVPCRIEVHDVGSARQAEAWYCYLDNEVVEARASVPQTVSLVMEHEGNWWLGWQTKHTLRVSATVAAEVMSSKEGIELTAVRWRLLPFPLFVLPPLITLAALLWLWLR